MQRKTSWVLLFLIGMLVCNSLPAMATETLKRVPISEILYDESQIRAIDKEDKVANSVSDVKNPLEKIILTADRVEVQPGETVHIIAKLKTGAGKSLKEVAFVPVGDGTSIGRDRYTFSHNGLELTVHIQEDFNGTCEFSAVGLVDDEPAVSNKLMIVSRPNSEEIIYLSFFQGPSASYLKGADIPLQVRAYTRDGKYFDVSNRQSGTVYMVSDTSVGRISEDGMFEALKAGTITIIAKNGKLKTAINIEVRTF